MITFPKKYNCLKKQIFDQEEYKIIPIRCEDRYKIMQWRNEQIYHLRQEKPLSKKEQDKYFENTVSKLFEIDQPDQILFSFLKKDKLIGYGGLVHIDWKDKNAEISFLMDTELEKNNFGKYWHIFLLLIEEVAFKEINLNKIYTYAFDLRPNLFDVLINSGYKEDARLKKHCLYENKYIDVLIHFKINDKL